MNLNAKNAPEVDKLELTNTLTEFFQDQGVLEEGETIDVLNLSTYRNKAGKLRMGINIAVYEENS